MAENDRLHAGQITMSFEKLHENLKVLAKPPKTIHRKSR